MGENKNAPSTSDSELGCITGLILFAFWLPVSLLSIKFGDALFMRLFYGTGEHAPHLINSKHGTLSDGHSIPMFLNFVRLAINVIPMFVLTMAFALVLISLKRRWKRR